MIISMNTQSAKKVSDETVLRPHSMLENKIKYVKKFMLRVEHFAKNG